MLRVNVSGTSGGRCLARRVSDPNRDFDERSWHLSGWADVSQGAFMPPNNIVNQFGLVSVSRPVTSIARSTTWVSRPLFPAIRKDVPARDG